MRTIGRLILAAIFLILAGLLMAAAMYIPGFFDYYTDISRAVLGAMSTVTGLFPFAVWEIGLVLLILLALYFLFRNRKFFRWLSGIALLVSIGVFLFVALWGLNHYGPSVADRVGMQVTEHTRDQLRSTAQYMADQAGLWADQVDRDSDGLMAIDLDHCIQTAVSGYDTLAQTNDFFRCADAPVKPLLSSELFSYMGITGIFMAFTAESNINTGTYCASLPFTICHELAHRMTVAAEDEANFCAFLACRANPDPVFQYSGWYSAFVYTYNALYKVDKTAAAEVWASLSETVRNDCLAANRHYDPYEGQVQETAQKFNDAYLKAFNEESGVQSYGEVADLLIAWYLKES